MNFGKVSLACVAFVGLQIAPVYAENESIYFGLGMGPDHGGVGARLGIQKDEWLASVGLGCTSYNADNGTNCGASLSLTNTSILFKNNDKHGLSLYAGIIDDQLKEQTENAELESVFGYGIGYQYFYNGISRSGFNLALYLVRENFYDKRTSIRWQAAYAF